MAVTIITGASSGIGRALAIELARRGEAIALLARRRDAIEQAAAEIRNAGGQALACPRDVTDKTAVLAAFEQAARHFGPITRVVANAGGGYRVAALALRGEEVADMLAVNVVGAANCVEAALPHMLAQGSGHLVFMGSLAGGIGLPGAAGYSAAKAAVARLAESLRVELKPHGIDVTLLSPGFVRTRDARKKRPFEVPLDKAVITMANAIASRRPVSRFPWQLKLLLAASAMLPAGVRDSLLRRFGKAATKLRPAGPPARG